MRVRTGAEISVTVNDSDGSSSVKRTSHALQTEKRVFGHLPGGAEILEYTVRNKAGIVAKLINYGATLKNLLVTGREGKAADVVLGFDDLRGYVGDHPFFGGTIGRFANRIAQGRFSLNGDCFQLAINDPPNSLHGGKEGFHRKVWNATAVDDGQGASVRFAYTSEDGEENYPGTVTATLTYTLTDENELKLEYTAETDKATPLNLTNHSYFNLAGAGDILDHILFLNADSYTPVDGKLIPTGEIRSVGNSPLDFSKPAAIGARIGELREIGGYDHNFVLNGKNGDLRLAARLTEPYSGRQMEVWTSEPGIQFYSGVQLDGSVIGKGGMACNKYSGLCLETQHFPDSPNHANFPTAILQPGTKFRSVTIYKFSAKQE